MESPAGFLLSLQDSGSAAGLRLSLRKLRGGRRCWDGVERGTGGRRCRRKCRIQREGDIEDRRCWKGSGRYRIREEMQEAGGGVECRRRCRKQEEIKETVMQDAASRGGKRQSRPGGGRRGNRLYRATPAGAEGPGEGDIVPTCPQAPGTDGGVSGRGPDAPLFASSGETRAGFKGDFLPHSAARRRGHRQARTSTIYMIRDQFQFSFLSALRKCLNE